MRCIQRWSINQTCPDPPRIHEIAHLPHTHRTFKPVEESNSSKGSAFRSFPESVLNIHTTVRGAGKWHRMTLSLYNNSARMGRLLVYPATSGRQCTRNMFCVLRSEIYTHSRETEISLALPPETGWISTPAISGQAGRCIPIHAIYHLQHAIAMSVASFKRRTTLFCLWPLHQVSSQHQQTQNVEEHSFHFGDEVFSFRHQFLRLNRANTH